MDNPLLINHFVLDGFDLTLETSRRICEWSHCGTFCHFGHGQEVAVGI